jgi:hypothetical protein
MRIMLICLAVVALSGCGNGSADCVAAGGQCVLGGGPCQGTQGPQDCDSAPYNPGGGFCCLPCPVGQTPNDAGLPTTGCH